MSNRIDGPGNRPNIDLEGPGGADAPDSTTGPESPSGGSTFPEQDRVEEDQGGFWDSVKDAASDAADTVKDTAVAGLDAAAELAAEALQRRGIADYSKIGMLPTESTESILDRGMETLESVAADVAEFVSSDPDVSEYFGPIKSATDDSAIETTRKMVEAFDIEKVADKTAEELAGVWAEVPDEAKDFVAEKTGFSFEDDGVADVTSARTREAFAAEVAELAPGETVSVETDLLFDYDNIAFGTKPRMDITPNTTGGVEIRYSAGVDATVPLPVPGGIDSTFKGSTRSQVVLNFASAADAHGAVQMMKAGKTPEEVAAAFDVNTTQVFKELTGGVSVGVEGANFDADHGYRVGVDIIDNEPRQWVERSDVTTADISLKELTNAAFDATKDAHNVDDRVKMIFDKLDSWSGAGKSASKTYNSADGTPTGIEISMTESRGNLEYARKFEFKQLGKLGEICNGRTAVELEEQLRNGTFTVNDVVNAVHQYNLNSPAKPAALEDFVGASAEITEKGSTETRSKKKLIGMGEIRTTTTPQRVILRQTIVGDRSNDVLGPNAEKMVDGAYFDDGTSAVAHNEGRAFEVFDTYKIDG